MIPFPKIIHQTWKDSNIPEDWKISQQEWKRLHPTWTYILWTDEDNLKYIEKNYPDFLDTYIGFEYNIQRADAIRNIMLYDFGGVYSDLDTVPSKSLDTYNFGDSDVYLIKSSNTPLWYTNSFMISKPRVKLWKDIIDYMTTYQKPWYIIGKHLKVMFSTGPMALSKNVEKYDGIVSVLPLESFNPISASQLSDGAEIPSTSYVYPIEGKSWNEWDSTLINFFMKYSTIMGVLFVVLLVIIIVWVVWNYYRRKECEVKLVECKNA